MSCFGFTGDKPAPLERIAYLDGWRGVAIALVLQDHFSPLRGFDAGRLGVDVFFCLSGFLMSRLLFIKRLPLPLFYKRRFSRVLPAFFLFLVFVYGASLWFKHPISATEVFSTLLFFRTYYPAEPGIWSTGFPIGHLWSLNVEEHGYILMSILTLPLILRKREGYALVAGGLLALCIELFYAFYPQYRPYDPGIRTECAAKFLFLSAGYCLFADKVRRFVHPSFPLIALIAAAFCYTSYAPWWSRIVIPPFFLAFSVNHLSEAYAAIHRFLASVPLRMLGIWSFSLYLWQQPFYAYERSFPPGMALAGTILAGLLSFYCVENPARTWLNKNW